MWDIANSILLGFRNCFSRKAAFEWFCICAVGIMCRHDSLGATSIARALMLEPALYGCLMHFFHAHSWEAGKISQQWAGMLGRFAYKAHGMPVLIADGVKAAKEGRKMPGAQKIALKTGGKSAQIGIGQMFGAVGLLIGDGFAQCCPIVSIRLRSGQKGMAAWEAMRLAKQR